MALTEHIDGVHKAEMRQQRLDRAIEDWVSGGNTYDLKPENVRIPGLPVVNFIEERRLNDHLRDLGKKRHRLGLIHENDHNRFLEKQLTKPELRKKFIADLLQRRDAKMLTRISISGDISEDLEDYRTKRLGAQREQTRSINITRQPVDVKSGKTVSLSQSRPLTYTHGVGTSTRAGRVSPTADILPPMIRERTPQDWSVKNIPKTTTNLPSITSNPKFERLEGKLCRKHGQILERRVTCIVKNVDALHVPPQTQRTSKGEIGNRIREYLIKVGLVKKISK